MSSETTPARGAHGEPLYDNRGDPVSYDELRATLADALAALNRLRAEIEALKAERDEESWR